MTIEKLARILAKHSINFTIVDTKVIAEDQYTINGVLHTDTIVLTDISPKQLYAWLGY